MPLSDTAAAQSERRISAARYRSSRDAILHRKIAATKLYNAALSIIA
jgi:hypothetical protein